MSSRGPCPAFGLGAVQWRKAAAGELDVVHAKTRTTMPATRLSLTIVTRVWQAYSRAGEQRKNLTVIKR